MSYNSFKSEFLKMAQADNCDTGLLEGFLDSAHNEYLNWERIAKAAAVSSRDPEFFKVAFHAVASQLEPMVKKADPLAQPAEANQGMLGSFGPQILGLMQSLGSTVGGKDGGSGLGGMLAGSGGGLVMGLLLSEMFGIPLSTSLLLSTLGGGALGYLGGGTEAGKNFLDPSRQSHPAAPVDPAAQPAAAKEEPAAPQPQEPVAPKPQPPAPMPAPAPAPGAKAPAAPVVPPVALPPQPTKPVSPINTHVDTGAWRNAAGSPPSAAQFPKPNVAQKPITPIQPITPVTPKKP